jgi:hypothetical protein
MGQTRALESSLKAESLAETIKSFSQFLERGGTGLQPLLAKEEDRYPYALILLRLLCEIALRLLL